MSATVEHESGPGDSGPGDHDAVEEPSGEERAVEELDEPDADEQVDPGPAEPEPVDPARADLASADVEQDAPAPSPAQLRVDFGAHFEANYQRLVAQLYAITLDPGEAHDVVQDAYSRAWRRWATVGRSPDPTAWVRRVAVRSTIRSWRRVLARIGIGRPRPVGDGGDARTGALLAALGRLPAPERRCVVLAHMAGSDLAEIAAVEQVSVGTVQARLARARLVVTDGVADVLRDLPGDGADQEYDGAEYDEPEYDSADYDRDLYAVYDNKEEYR